MMVFSPYYENSMPGDNEFGKPLPFVTDDAGTPFAIARSSVLPLQQACLCGWKRLETPGLWLGSPRLALRLAPTRQRSTPIPVRPYSLCKDVLPSRRCEHFDPARHALGALRSEHLVRPLAAPHVWWALGVPTGFPGGQANHNS
jgi:hypothetical protein